MNVHLIFLIRHLLETNKIETNIRRRPKIVGNSQYQKAIKLYLNRFSSDLGITENDLSIHRVMCIDT